MRFSAFKHLMFFQGELSLMSFEGVQVQGAAQILDKIKVRYNQCLGKGRFFLMHKALYEGVCMLD